MMTKAFQELFRDDLIEKVITFLEDGINSLITEAEIEKSMELTTTVYDYVNTVGKLQELHTKITSLYKELNSKVIIN